MRKFAIVLLVALIAAAGLTFRRQWRRQAPALTSATASSPSGPPSIAERTTAPLRASNPNVALGMPVDDDPSDDTILDHGAYVVSYDHARNAANWSGWRLVEGDIGSAGRHKGAFMTDEMLPAGWYRAQHNDYTHAGYSRGHLTDSADRSATRSANDLTFLLTNVLPQTQDLNAGPWLRLEDHCRRLAQREHRTLYIVAGGLFSKAPARVGHGVAVPSAFYKVIVALPAGAGADAVGAAGTVVIAVVMPNVTGVSHEPWTGYKVTVREMERKSGYRMFGNMAAPVRSALEARGAE